VVASWPPSTTPLLLVAPDDEPEEPLDPDVAASLPASDPPAPLDVLDPLEALVALPPELPVGLPLLDPEAPEDPEPAA
jgi:hypothetical protein